MSSMIHMLFLLCWSKNDSLVEVVGVCGKIYVDKTFHLILKCLSIKWIIENIENLLTNIKAIYTLKGKYTHIYNSIHFEVKTKQKSIYFQYK